MSEAEENIIIREFLALAAIKYPHIEIVCRIAGKESDVPGESFKWIEYYPSDSEDKTFIDLEEERRIIEELHPEIFDFLD